MAALPHRVSEGPRGAPSCLASFQQVNEATQPSSATGTLLLPPPRPNAPTLYSLCSPPVWREAGELPQLQGPISAPLFRSTFGGAQLPWLHVCLCTSSASELGLPSGSMVIYSDWSREQGVAGPLTKPEVLPEGPGWETWPRRPIRPLAVCSGIAAPRGQRGPGLGGRAPGSVLASSLLTLHGSTRQALHSQHLSFPICFLGVEDPGCT